MMPCSSGNSPTMSVSRSALASSAARSACAASASPPSCAPIQRARCARTRRTRSPWRAELAVVDDLVEPGDARLERALAVLVEEELGVGQARPHDALVAFDDRAPGRPARMLLTTRKRLVSRPSRVEQREVLLVRLHRQDEALRRHGEELGVEAAGQHVRPLDQRGDLVEQRLVVDRREPLPTAAAACELARDLGAALVEARDHRAFVAQLLRVAVGVAQRRSARAAPRSGGRAWCGRRRGRAPRPARRRRRAARPGRAPGGRSSRRSSRRRAGTA